MRSGRLQVASIGVWLVVCLAACGHEGKRYEARGDRYSALGEHLDARVEYELALTESGTDAPFGLRLKAAELMLAAKDFDDAAERFHDLIERRPDYADEISALYHLHAERWLATGDTFAALQAIGWLQARDSTTSLDRLHYVLGDVAFLRPDYDRAMIAYLLGLSRDPAGAPADVYVRLGDAFDRKRNCVAAVTYFETYLSMAGNDGSLAEDGRYRLGACALRLAQRAFVNGDYVRAMDDVQRMIKTGEPASRLAEARLLTGRLHERFGNRQAAIQYYRRVVDNDENVRSRPAIEAYRRLKQLEFGMPLETDTEPEPVPDEESGEG
jgi:tetratricopeptide (TPR) repeat protein